VVRPDAETSLAGSVLDGRYKLIEPIGSGGVGVVYRARRLSPDRPVAVKVLHDIHVQNAEFVRRFQREAMAMSRLYHPHCVALSDFGVFRSRPYLVLEYLSGQTVTKLLEDRPFVPTRAVNVTLQLLEVLDYFHGHHVIHRDLKSENVMLIEASGSIDFVKVLDFGMVKILEGPGADSQLSKVGILPGTPSTMAPEQIHQLTPDPRIDVYATGILLYEMVVGRRPFHGQDGAAILKMQLTTPPPPPRQILGEGALSAELEQVIFRALEKDRVRRFASANDMAEALRLTPEARTNLNPAATRRGPTGQPTPVVLVRRPSWVVPAAVGAVFLFGALVAALVWSRGTSPETPVPVTTAPPPPSPRPTPTPVPEPWLAHRDLAVTYTQRRQPDDAFREVKAAIADNAAAAAVDASLVDAAIAALAPDRVSFVVDAFRSNPHLVDGLAKVASAGPTAGQRHAAHEGLRTLGQEARVDLVAMRILDVEEATACRPMRVAFSKLRASASKDPRVKTFANTLRSRGRKSRQVICLGRALGR
jgi:serine/threonine protein kinase